MEEDWGNENSQDRPDSSKAREVQAKRSMMFLFLC